MGNVLKPLDNLTHTAASCQQLLLLIKGFVPVVSKSSANTSRTSYQGPAVQNINVKKSRRFPYRVRMLSINLLNSKLPFDECIQSKGFKEGETLGSRN